MTYIWFNTRFQGALYTQFKYLLSIHKCTAWLSCTHYFFLNNFFKYGNMKSNETLFMTMKFKPCQILILKSATVKVNDSFCLTLTTCWAEAYCTHIFAVSIYLITTIQLFIRDLNTILYQIDSHLPQNCKTLNKDNICVQS